MEETSQQNRGSSGGSGSTTTSSQEEAPPTFASLTRAAFTTTRAAQSLDASASSPSSSLSSSAATALREEAFKEYDRALSLIDAALPLAPNTSESAEVALQLRFMRKQILERVSDLQTRPDNHPHQPPQPLPRTRGGGPCEPREPQFPPAYGDLEAALDEIAAEQGEEGGGVGGSGGGCNMPGPLPLHAREIYSIGSEVQIYFISCDDNVSAPSYPSFLRLVVLLGGEEEGGGRSRGVGGVVAASVPAFLQVGDWTYPLIPQHSPLFRSNEGIYIFPDLSNNIPGSYVGLILPDTVDAESRATFEERLLSLVGVDRFPPVIESTPNAQTLTYGVEAGETYYADGGTCTKEKPPRPPAPIPHHQQQPPSATPPTAERRLSTKIAEGLITGAEAVSRGLIAGASKTSHLLDKGAAYINTKIEPAREKSVVKPEVKAGMKTAKTVSGKAVQVSGFIVSQVGRATIALGRTMAPHVHKASTKFLARTVAVDEADACAKVDAVLEVTTGAMVGFGTVYFGLEHAGRTLVSSLANNSVRVVQHRYGDDMGEFANDTAATAGNAALTAWNAKNLAPKAVAKRVAKDTGRMVVNAHQEKAEKGAKNNRGNDGDGGLDGGGGGAYNSAS